MTDIFVSRIGFSTGEAAALGALPEILTTTGAADRLARGGLARYRESKLTAWELAADSARSTLDTETADTTDDVDVVVYATDSFWDGADRELDAARFLQAARLDRTPLVGVGLTGCANFAGALRTTVAYLRGGEATAALLAVTDVCQPGQRLLAGGTGILSDGAATCVVGSRRPERGLRLIGLTMAVEAGLHAVTAAFDSMAMAKATARGVNRATEALYRESGLGPADFAYLVTNNYVESTVQIFAGMAGIPYDRTYRDTAADYGHCYAADILINLATMSSTHLLEPEDRVLAIVTGHNSWGCMAFEVV